ncbi:MAG: YbcC family protein [Bacteroidia bacterium]
MHLLIEHALEHIRHYLPSQASLKDFIHHNTLHGFQDRSFHQACFEAAEVFGYSTYLSLEEYRALFASGRIREDILVERIRWALHQQQSSNNGTEAGSITDLTKEWLAKALNSRSDYNYRGRLGGFRQGWKDVLKMNLNKAVHPLLLRMVAAYLDQGISSWKFPFVESGLLENLRQLDRSTGGVIFGKRRAHHLLHNAQTSLEDLLGILVGDPRFFEAYLWDQQLEHPGWSGMVATLEFQESALLDTRKISFYDWVWFECLLEIDALDQKFPKGWDPLSKHVTPPYPHLFNDLEYSGDWFILRCWQEAYEWTYYRQVLNKLAANFSSDRRLQKPASADVQALFCIDDREHSLRRHLEFVIPSCSTYGTPGFFGVAFYFRPEHGQFVTKCCPFPIHPGHVIFETERKKRSARDYSMESHRQSLLRGMLTAGHLSLSSTARLLLNLVRPSPSPVMADSGAHMDADSLLEIEFKGDYFEGLQRGFTVQEMGVRVSQTLKSIGLTHDYAPLVYVIGHGASSANNPYYAGYDCGACCGRPGSVNARILAMMANRSDVRLLLEQEHGIRIPDDTRFVAGLHDTTLDSVVFYDTAGLQDPDTWAKHLDFVEGFHKALRLNKLERTSRFDNIDPQWSDSKKIEAIRQRAYAFYEPRPEWNHTDNALVLIGSAQLYRGHNWDKRPFINNYDYSQDPDGVFLQSILSAAIPVCGGINLEYYFSRVDPHRLGAGTKLPHNVVGLFAVNNGIDGDLRPGLPSQMVEIHEPIRLLYVVEHHPQVVQKLLNNNPALAQWVYNGWVWLAVHDPADGLFYLATSLEADFLPLTTQ